MSKSRQKIDDVCKQLEPRRSTRKNNPLASSQQIPAKIGAIITPWPRNCGSLYLRVLKLGVLLFWNVFALHRCFLLPKSLEIGIFKTGGSRDRKEPSVPRPWCKVTVYLLFQSVWEISSLLSTIWSKNQGSLACRHYKQLLPCSVLQFGKSLPCLLSVEILNGKYSVRAIRRDTFIVILLGLDCTLDGHKKCTTIGTIIRYRPKLDPKKDYLTSYFLGSVFTKHEGWQL